MLYRSGYGHKHHQERVLKIKLSHEALAHILEACVCKHGGGGTLGRVQWDPARDLLSAEANTVPRKMLRNRAIQIGMKGLLSQFYVDSVLSIEDVTDLSHEVGEAHAAMTSRKKHHRGSTETTAASSTPMQLLIAADRLPTERPYMPMCSPFHLERLGMLPGDTAREVAGLGRGKVGGA